MTRRTQLILAGVVTVAWFALAVSSLVRGAPFWVPLLYVVCGVAMGLTLRRMLGPARPKAKAGSPVNDGSRARRSGNPAVRAQARQSDSPQP
jgi:hypothetical protein